MKRQEMITRVLNWYEKGTSHITKSLSGKPLSAANKINRRINYTVDVRFNAIFDRMLTKYSSNTDVVIMELLGRIENAPLAKTVDEAQIFVALVEEINMDLVFFDPAREMSDAAKRFAVMMHLDPVEFKEFITDMQTKPNHPAWTFDETSEQLDKMSESERVLRINTTSDTKSDVLDTPAHDPGAATSMVNFSRDPRDPHSCVCQLQGIRPLRKRMPATVQLLCEAHTPRQRLPGTSCAQPSSLGAWQTTVWQGRWGSRGLSTAGVPRTG
jgi:hypothetical protein